MSRSEEGDVPEEFGRYQLIELIGRGGMGEVYRAQDTVRDRTVALKVLPDYLAGDESFELRFRRESRMAAKLNEPHIIPIHDFGEIDGRLFIDMRLVEGHDLGSILDSRGTLPVDVAVNIIGQTAAALDAAHASGLVHRDVKPSNILLTGASDDPDAVPFAYLVDFGIARSSTQGTALTATTATVGTVAYMSPERISGLPSDLRTDVYALACVLYETFTGHKPFEGEMFAQMYAHMNTEPPLASARRPEVSSGLDAVIARGMAKDPDQRYASAGTFAAAARAALRDAARTDTVQRSVSGLVAPFEQARPASEVHDLGAGPSAAGGWTPPPPPTTRPPTPPPTTRPPTPPPAMRPPTPPPVNRPPALPPVLPPQSRPATPSRSRRNGIIAAAAVLVIAVGVVIALVVANSGGGHTANPPPSGSASGSSTSSTSSSAATSSAPAGGLVLKTGTATTPKVSWAHFASFAKLLGTKDGDTTHALRDGTCKLSAADAADTKLGVQDEVNCSYSGTAEQTTVARFDSAAHLQAYFTDHVVNDGFSELIWTLAGRARGLSLISPHDGTGPSTISTSICGLPTYLVQVGAPDRTKIDTLMLHDDLWNKATFPDVDPPECNSTYAAALPSATVEPSSGPAKDVLVLTNSIIDTLAQQGDSSLAIVQVATKQGVDAIAVGQKGIVTFWSEGSDTVQRVGASTYPYAPSSLGSPGAAASGAVLTNMTHATFVVRGTFSGDGSGNAVAYTDGSKGWGAIKAQPNGNLEPSGQGVTSTGAIGLGDDFALTGGRLQTFDCSTQLPVSACSGDNRVIKFWTWKTNQFVQTGTAGRST